VFVSYSSIHSLKPIATLGKVLGQTGVRHDILTIDCPCFFLETSILHPETLELMSDGWISHPDSPTLSFPASEL
jgi:hypothetical protein